MSPIAERIATEYVRHLDMGNLSRLQVLMLHAIKNIAMSEWAKETLERVRHA